VMTWQANHEISTGKQRAERILKRVGGRIRSKTKALTLNEWRVNYRAEEYDSAKAGLTTMWQNRVKKMNEELNFFRMQKKMQLNKGAEKIMNNVANRIIFRKSSIGVITWRRHAQVFKSRKHSMAILRRMAFRSQNMELSDSVLEWQRCSRISVSRSKAEALLVRVGGRIIHQEKALNLSEWYRSYKADVEGVLRRRQAVLEEELQMKQVQIVMATQSGVEGIMRNVGRHILSNQAARAWSVWWKHHTLKSGAQKKMVKSVNHYTRNTKKRMISTWFTQNRDDNRFKRIQARAFLVVKVTSNRTSKRDYYDIWLKAKYAYVQMKTAKRFSVVLFQRQVFDCFRDWRYACQESSFLDDLLDCSVDIYKPKAAPVRLDDEPVPVASSIKEKYQRHVEEASLGTVAGLNLGSRIGERLRDPLRAEFMNLTLQTFRLLCERRVRNGYVLGMTRWKQMVTTAKLEVKAALTKAEAETEKAALQTILEETTAKHERAAKEWEESHEQNTVKAERVAQEVKSRDETVSSLEQEKNRMRAEKTKLEADMKILNTSLQDVQINMSTLLTSSVTIERQLSVAQKEKEEAVGELQRIVPTHMAMLETAEQARIEQLKHKDDLRERMLKDKEDEQRAAIQKIQDEVSSVKKTSFFEREQLEVQMTTERAELTARLEEVTARAQLAEATLYEAELDYLKKMKHAELEMMRTRDTSLEVQTRVTSHETHLAVLEATKLSALKELQHAKSSAARLAEFENKTYSSPMPGGGQFFTPNGTPGDNSYGADMTRAQIAGALNMLDQSGGDATMQVPLISVKEGLSSPVSQAAQAMLNEAKRRVKTEYTHTATTSMSSSRGSSPMPSRSSPARSLLGRRAGDDTFDAMDVNKDGVISREEFERFMKGNAVDDAYASNRPVGGWSNPESVRMQHERDQAKASLDGLMQTAKGISKMSGEAGSSK